MSAPDTSAVGTGTERQPGWGLALSSVSISSVGLVLAVSTWVAWLLVRPPMQDALAYAWLTIVFVLVLGALWFVVLPAAVLSIILGLVAARSPASAYLGRLGAFLGLVAFAIAAAGGITFVLDAPNWIPHTAYFGTGPGPQ